MITDLVNTSGDQFFKYPRWSTRLSADDTPPQDSADIVDSAPLDANSFTAMVVHQSAGGQSFDHVDLEWAVQPLIDRVLPADFTRMLDVLFPDTDVTRAALCDYVQETEDVDSKREILTAQGQFRGALYGPVFEGQRWTDQLASIPDATPIETNQSPIFNPRIDGVVLPNQSDIQENDFDNRDEAFFWCPPEFARTPTSQAGFIQIPELWNLKSAVHSMIWACNPDETFLTNPVLADLVVLDSAPTIEDVKLPIGKELDFYLDRLLQPNGFNWYIDYETGEGDEPNGDYQGKFANDAEADAADPTPGPDDSYFNTTTMTTFVRNAGNTAWEDTGEVDSEHKFNKNKPKIVVFEQGVGTEKDLFFAAPATDWNADDNNLNKYSIDWSIGDATNVIRVLGGFERAEVTFEVYKGWDPSDDALTASDLDKSDSASMYAAKPTVHRLWVGNEDGEFTASRAEITGALDLSSIFELWFPHRREMEDPFTYQGEPDGRQRRQVWVEYSVAAGSPVWQPVPNEGFGQPFIVPGTLQLLWQGDQPPTVLIDAGTDARVRVTCVVAGDAQIEGLATRETWAVNGRDVPLVLNLPQKFQHNFVQDTGPFASSLFGDPAGEDVKDDTVLIQDYAETLRAQYTSAEAKCRFELPGIHTFYEIGNLIASINGRNIDLNQASDTAPEPRYPQVVGRTYSYRKGSSTPITLLTVDRGVRRGPPAGPRGPA